MISERGFSITLNLDPAGNAIVEDDSFPAASNDHIIFVFLDHKDIASLLNLQFVQFFHNLRQAERPFYRMGGALRCFC